MEECIPGIETEKLKQAARYLLDPIYGAKRTERFIGWIARSEKPRLQKEARCMDIVFKLFTQLSDKIIVFGEQETGHMVLIFLEMLKDMGQIVLWG